MESIFEEWNGTSGTGNVSDTYPGHSGYGFSAGDGADGSDFPISQVGFYFYGFIHRLLLTTHRRIRTQCFRFKKSQFQQHERS